MKHSILVLLLASTLWPQDDEIRTRLSRVSEALREKVAPSVVGIQVDRLDDPEGKGARGERAEHQDYYSRPAGFCTGTIVSSDGLILTTAFNVSGTIKKITVVTGEKKAGELKRYEAKLLAYDQTKDVGLLKIEASDLPMLTFAKTADVKVGDYTFLVGRAPDPEQPTINYGIVSAMHRFGGSHLQSDAETNYGNVGGPLVTLDGSLLGIMTHIKPRFPWGQSSGIGFCFKNDGFAAMIEKLKKGQSTVRPGESRTTYLGVILDEEAKDGVIVGEVMADSPADEAGMRQGDSILEFDGQPVKTPKEFNKMLKSKSPGDKVKIKVRRKGKEDKDEEKTLEATLQEEPG